MTYEAESHLTLNPSSNASPAGGLKESIDINGETWVYHCACSHGAVLYVGVAVDVARRLRQHKAKDWWPEVDVVIADLYPTRAQALEVEAHCIADGNRSHMRNRIGMVDEIPPPHAWLLRQYWGVDAAGHLEPLEPFANTWTPSGVSV